MNAPHLVSRPAFVPALAALLLPFAAQSNYVNSFSDGKVIWNLSADCVQGTYYSDSGNWPANVSVVFSGGDGHMFDWGVIYYNMTLTGYSRASGNTSTEITIPSQIQWDSGGSDGIGTGPLQFIASGAFESKEALTKVNIPYQIRAIKLPCFRGCPNLEEIRMYEGSVSTEMTDPARASFRDSNYVSKDGVLYNADMTKLIKYPEGKTDKFFVVPETVTELAPYCFANTKLVAVQFQGDCPTLDSTSFSGSKCVIYHNSDAAGWPEPNGGFYRLIGWLNPSTPTFPLAQSGSVHGCMWNGCEIIDGVAWCYRIENDSATVVYVPDQLDIASLEIPETLGGIIVSGIEDDFQQPPKVASVTIPASVTTIGWAPFGGYSAEYNLSEICVASGNSEFYDIDGVLFSADGTLLVCPCQKSGDYSIPDGTVTVLANAFNGCDLLTSIHIPASATDIGVYSLGVPKNCASFTVDAANPEYSSIGGCLFSKDGKTLLRVPGGMTGTYSIPEGVSVIGDQAFMYCNISNLVIAASVCEIPAFAWSTGLEAISVAEGNELYHAHEDVLFSDADSTLLWCSPAKTGTYIVPGDVKAIGYGAFAYGNLTNIVISEGVKTIDDAVFKSYNLREVSLPNSLCHVGNGLFDGCYKLEKITVPYAWKNYVSDWNLPETCEVFVLDKISLFIATDTMLPIALTGVQYWEPLSAAGGLNPYTWEIVDDDDWPEWLSSNHIDYWEDWGYDCPYLSGWPGEDDIGLHSFTLRVTDAEGTIVEKTFSVEVVENPNHAPIIESWSPNSGNYALRVGESLSFSVVASDPDGDDIEVVWYLYRKVYDEDDEGWYWSQIGTLTSNENGSVNFSQPKEGVYEFQVAVSDGERSAEQWLGAITVVAADALMIDASDLPHALEGVDYAVQLTATGGTAPYTWSIADNGDGTEISEDGLLQLWTAGWSFDSEYTTENYDITVTDAEGRSTMQTITIVIDNNPNDEPVIDAVSPDGWYYNAGITTPVGEEIVFSVEAHDPEGEPLSFIWRLDDVELGKTGSTWSWTPERADIGSHEVSVRCSDGERNSWWRSWYFNVVTTNVLSAEIALPTAVVGEPYASAFSVSGGTEPYAWGAPEYAMTREESTFAEVGVAQDWDTDDGCWNVSLPFSFPFYGQTYDTIYVSDNGTICLDGAFSKYAFNESDFRSHAIIAPHWSDMDGRLQTAFIDSSTEDAITIRWRTYYWGDSVRGTMPIEFSATLCENGEIRFAYGGNAQASAVGISAGDGVRFDLPAALRNASLGGSADVVFRPATFAPGLTLASNGTVSGTPTTAGTYRIPVSVVDDEGSTWSGEAVLYVVADAESSTLTTSVPVPHSFLDTDYPLLLSAHGGDYEAAANAPAANGVNKVWECYVAGIDPTDEEARFEATIEIGPDGKPEVKWNPPLSEEETAKRIYRTYGRKTLDPKEEWTAVTDVSDLDAAGWKFFKAAVEMK